MTGTQFSRTSKTTTTKKIGLRGGVRERRGGGGGEGRQYCIVGAHAKLDKEGMEEREGTEEMSVGE